MWTSAFAETAVLSHQYVLDAGQSARTSKYIVFVLMGLRRHKHVTNKQDP